MALIVQKKGALSGGVNQQAAEYRLSNQVEEMVNCFPTLDKGLVKRNPTKNVPFLNSSQEVIEFENSDAYYYEFDRGEGAVPLSRFSISIGTLGLRILDVVTGRVYTKDDGIIFDKTSEEYLTLSKATRNSYCATAIKDAVFIGNKQIQPSMTPIAINDTYRKRGYIWIKRTDALDGYRYGCTITLNVDGKETDYVIPLGTAVKDSSAAATALATSIRNANAVFAGTTSSGSVVEIQATHEVIGVSAIDTYGDSASFGWGWKVDSVSNLPQSAGTFNTVVRVGKTSSASYWLEYKGGIWEEIVSPDVDVEIDGNTMPHLLQLSYVSETDVNFTLSPYNWDDRKVGDDKTNKKPQFLLDNGNIKDIFFFRNRMGLLTSSGVSLSEVGEYGNFFRTSVATLLDSDRIDSGVESRSSVNLEHSIVFDDSVLFFSNQSQFRFEGADILSPSAFKITEITNYEVNLDVRPLPMDNKVYFVTKRGAYSALFEMVISNSSTKSSEAVDISAHCQSYIDQEINRLTGSPVNNTLFLSSKQNPNILFVYKYYNYGGTRQQSAWCKWEFNGSVYNAFCLSEDLYLYIDRVGALSEEWIMSEGEWNMREGWLSTGLWVMERTDLPIMKVFENMKIYPQNHTLEFKDGGTTNVEAYVNFGEWVYGAEGNKRKDGNLRFKTITVIPEVGSNFNLWVGDLGRDTYREIDSKYVQGRKPLISGNSKNMRTGIISESSTGFKIDSVTFEGDFHARSTLQ